MGEVYRATDLKLGQPVALKFLLEVAYDPGALARFHSEVRIARQVSHPNVCRVYDIGDVEGMTYLCMEYVDGEDLGSLLRRIGHLPGEKGIEIARRLCAGLSAAHQKGVIHRDLKPANVMIDGRGQVLITDFGLAGLMNQLQGADLRSGTPQYMAPEQLAGSEVSQQSDIYSLGLVLYEMFTGRRPFVAGSLAELVRLHQESKPPALSASVRDIDPAVERIILHCLDPDPRSRPQSALAVSAALPGGDPLAAALAAGETPSPHMVAASGDASSARLPVILGCAAAIVAGLAVAAIFNLKLSILGKTAMENSPAVLSQKAREQAASFGYIEAPEDTAHGLRIAADLRRWANERNINWDFLKTGRPAAVLFWYRESPQVLNPEMFSSDGAVSPGNPPPTLSGMLSMNLDPQGRLLELEAVPPQHERPDLRPAAPFDWSKLFEAAGLDMAQFQPSEPEWAPLGHFDSRSAWTGAFPGGGLGPILIEAASWRGKPVLFKIIGPWTEPSRQGEAPVRSGQTASRILSVTLFGSVLIGGLMLARHNLRQGRGDRRGAFRVAGFIFLAGLISFICTASHVPNTDELPLMIMGIGLNLFQAGLFWVVYIALEPFLRRRWPHAIVSWTRLLAGRIHDPLVGRDVLIGCVIGVLMALASQGSALASSHGGELSGELATLESFGALVANYLGDFANAILTAFAIFLVLFMLRLVLRKEWLAALAFVLIFGSAGALGSKQPVVDLAFAYLILGLLVYGLLRFGLVTMAIAAFISNTLPFIPLPSNLSHWAAPAGLAPFVVVGALAAFAFHAALGGRRLLKDDLLA